MSRTFQGLLHRVGFSPRGVNLSAYTDATFNFFQVHIYLTERKFIVILLYILKVNHGIWRV